MSTHSGLYTRSVYTADGHRVAAEEAAEAFLEAFTLRDGGTVGVLDDYAIDFDQLASICESRGWSYYPMFRDLPRVSAWLVAFMV